ncbi:hypothetical protein SLA2020_434490 [Shorea laevis]
MFIWVVVLPDVWWFVGGVRWLWTQRCTVLVDLWHTVVRDLGLAVVRDLGARTLAVYASFGLNERIRLVCLKRKGLKKKRCLEVEDNNDRRSV